MKKISVNKTIIESNNIKKVNIIYIYEPAMCCATGICGVGVDSELLRISTLINNLKKEGILIIRYNLNNYPNEFIKNIEIYKLIMESGVNKLPATVVDGKIVKEGKYPTIEEIYNWLNIEKMKENK